MLSNVIYRLCVDTSENCWLTLLDTGYSELHEFNSFYYITIFNNIFKGCVVFRVGWLTAWEEASELKCIFDMSTSITYFLSRLRANKSISRLPSINLLRVSYNYHLSNSLFMAISLTKNMIVYFLVDDLKKMFISETSHEINVF